MSMNRLWRNCLARSTRMFEADKCTFMSGTQGHILLLLHALFFSLHTARVLCNAFRLTFKEIVSLSIRLFILKVI